MAKRIQMRKNRFLALTVRTDGAREREKQHLYAEFANTLIHFEDGFAGQRQTHRKEVLRSKGKPRKLPIESSGEGERGREGKVAIRIPISGSASHASALAPLL